MKRRTLLKSPAIVVAGMVPGFSAIADVVDPPVSFVEGFYLQMLKFKQNGMNPILQGLMRLAGKDGRCLNGITTCIVENPDLVRYFDAMHQLTVDVDERSEEKILDDRTNWLEHFTNWHDDGMMTDYVEITWDEHMQMLVDEIKEERKSIVDDLAKYSNRFNGEYIVPRTLLIKYGLPTHGSLTTGQLLTKEIARLDKEIELLS